MSEHDFEEPLSESLEEAHYWWSISNIVDLIDTYGYTKVLMDIDKTIRAQDLEVELKQSVTED